MSLYLGNNLISGNKPINLGVRNIGEIVYSSLPLTDAGLHLLDGSLILGGGIYQGFVDYIAELYDNTSYIDKTFIQPTLTANGTLGGSSFAVSASAEGQVDSNPYRTYEAFDNNSSTYWRAGVATGWIEFYNPTPLKVTNLRWSCYYNYPTGGNVQGSNDGSTWTTLTTWTNSSASDFNISLSSNTNYYKYYRINITGVNTDVIHCAQINITATYQEKSAFCTEEQWQNSVTQYGSCGKFVYTAPLHLYAWKYDNSIIYTQINEDVDEISENILYNADGTTYEDGYNETYTDFGGISKIQKDNIITVVWVNPNSTKPTTRTRTIIYSRSAEDDVDIVESVRLPKVSDILQSTTDINALGDLIEAGLPNITGTFRSDGSTDYSGACYHKGDITGAGIVWSSTSGSDAIVGIDASRSSSIYGNSSTVQPQTIKAFVYIVVANSTKTSIQVDIDNIATDLNNKADVDLSNTNDTAKILMSGMGMPSDSYIDLTLGASGSTYTAPANGWILVACTGTAGSTYMEIVSNSHSACASYNGGWGRAMAPVLKGQTFDVYYGGKNFASRIFRFVYAQGSKN